MPSKDDFEKTNDFVNNFVNASKKKSEEMGTFNTLITGKTGVGKSTLINAIFKDNLAETGVGAPVTDSIKMITKDDVPIKIYDTVGLELNQEKQKQVIDDINHIIAETGKKDKHEHIHCIWYCVSGNSSRLEDEEEKYINQLADSGIPIIVVITKSYSNESKELKEYIKGRKNLSLKIKGICRIVAKNYSESNLSARVFGLKDLVDITRLIISDDVVDAFAAAQIVDITFKRKKANIAISSAVALAAVQCVNPIPMSDAPILIGIQTSMMASIALVYGVKISKDDIMKMLPIMLSTQGVKFAGVTIAGFLRSVVGVGTFMGGVISVVVGTSLTAALGKTYALIMEEILLNKLDLKDLDNRKWKETINRIIKKVQKDEVVFE